MAATPAWRESRYVRPAWFAISAATSTRPRKLRLRNRPRWRDAGAQCVEASFICRDVGAPWCGLDMPNRRRAVARVEKEICLACRSIEAPDLRAAIVAHKGRHSELCAQIGFVQPRRARRLTGRRRRRKTNL